LPSQVKGAGLRRLSRRGSWVQIPPPAPRQSARTPGKRAGRWEKVTPSMKGRILQVLMTYKNRLTVRTLQDYGDALTRLVVEIKDLDEVDRAGKAISSLKGHWLESSIAAYRLYCKVHRLPEPEFTVRREHRRQLPRIPPERTLQASLAVVQARRWKAFFRLLYEAGARPSEPFYLRVRDVDSETDKVRLGTLKFGGDTTERDIPISPLLSAMLRELTKGQNPEDYVFGLKTDPRRPMGYTRAERVMRAVRKQLRDSGYDVQGLRLHAYRHAFATRLYTATRELPLVQRSLGHKDLRSTMIYIHIQPATPRLYDVQVHDVKDEPGISGAIGEGWEKALQTTDKVWFRRPRWVP